MGELTFGQAMEAIEVAQAPQRELVEFLVGEFERLRAEKKGQAEVIARAARAVGRHASLCARDETGELMSIADDLEYWARRGGAEEGNIHFGSHGPSFGVADPSRLAPADDQSKGSD